jgi:hypothetical protein
VTEPIFASIAGERPRPRRWLRIGALTVLLLVVSLVSVVLWAANRPAVIQAIVRWLVDDPAITLTFDDLAIDPLTGHVTMTGVLFAHTDPMTPTVRISALGVSVPMPSDFGHTLSIAEAEVVGLDIHAHRQRPAPAWEPSDPWLREIQVANTHIHGATWRADRDAPLEVAAVTGITGQIADLRYVVGPRLLSGTAELKAQRFRSGALILTGLALTVTAEDSDVHWKNGRFRLAGGTGVLSGKVSGLFRTPTVRLDGTVTTLRLERLIEMATGQQSPLKAEVSGDVTVRTGGAMKRGDASIDAELHVTNAHLPLDLAPEGLVRAALRVTPLVRVDALDEIHLRELTGKIGFYRGRVTIDRLLYASRREVRVDGVIDATDGVRLLVRQARLRPMKQLGEVGQKVAEAGEKVGEALSALVPEVQLGKPGEKAKIFWPKLGRKKEDEPGATTEESPVSEVSAEPDTPTDRAAWGFVVVGQPGEVHLRLATREELAW